MGISGIFPHRGFRRLFLTGAGGSSHNHHNHHNHHHPIVNRQPSIVN